MCVNKPWGALNIIATGLICVVVFACCILGYITRHKFGCIDPVTHRCTVSCCIIIVGITWFDGGGGGNWLNWWRRCRRRRCCCCVWLYDMWISAIISIPTISIQKVSTHPRLDPIFYFNWKRWGQSFLFFIHTESTVKLRADLRCSLDSASSVTKSLCSVIWLLV